MLAAGTLFQPRINELMLDILSNPGIHHRFVRARRDVPGVRIFRKSGTWKNHHADSALVEQDGRRYVMVAIAEDPAGGDWLVRLPSSMSTGRKSAVSSFISAARSALSPRMVWSLSSVGPSITLSMR